MKALSIISIISAVLGLAMAIAGFFMDSYLGPVGSYVWRTADLLLLVAYLVISIICNKKRKSLQEEPDESPDSRA